MEKTFLFILWILIDKKNDSENKKPFTIEFIVNICVIDRWSINKVLNCHIWQMTDKRSPTQKHTDTQTIIIISCVNGTKLENEQSSKRANERTSVKSAL